MKNKLLLFLLISLNLAFAKPKEKLVAGPSIALIMEGYFMDQNMVHFRFRIINNGDQPLTNVTVTNIDYPHNGLINIVGVPIASLAPGEEDTTTFSAYTYNQCVDLSQAIVHATTPGNTEITDLSSPYSYYQDDITYTYYNAYADFSQQGIYQDLNSNSIVDVGDAINYNYTLNYSTNQSDFIVSDSNATLSNPTGNAYGWSSSGIHYITQAEVDLGYVYNCPYVQFINSNCTSYSFSDPTPCISCPDPTTSCNNVITTKITDLLSNNIVGNVKFNANNDGCATGLNFPNRKIVATNGSTTYASYTNNNGNYNIYIPNTGVYTTTATSNLGANFSSNPTSVAITSSGENIDYSGNFCISSSTNYTDLQVVLYPIDHARPGFNSFYRLYFRNNGSTNLNGTIQLTYDNAKLSIVAANPAQNSATSNTLTWNYSNLLPFEQRYIYITFNAFTPPTVNQDDILSFTAVGNPIAGDNHATDNTFALDQTVVSSFDPNDKTVLEGAYIQASQANEYLHYITRFQNTGTAAATTVVLKETLDSNLDWSTFEPVDASHIYNIQVKDGNQLTCTFSNIGLPDSTTNEPASHGWLSYKIKPKSGFSIGDIASSDAAIYFDYNPPIITNTVTTQIATLSNNGFTENNFKIYPNPANNYFVIENNTAGFCTYEIYDTGGKLLSNGNVENRKPIDISKFQSGLYFVSIKTENTKQTYKIIKQ
nr:T9SS type A sorting domain-containing protein [uncultured Flavobacterium sp.]